MKFQWGDLQYSVVSLIDVNLDELTRLHSALAEKVVNIWTEIQL